MSDPGEDPGEDRGEDRGKDRGKDRGTAGERGWSLSATAAGEGVRLELGLPDLGGKPVTAILSLTRTEARAFARALLAASGDAAERTFPQPPER